MGFLHAQDIKFALMGGTRGLTSYFIGQREEFKCIHWSKGGVQVHSLFKGGDLVHFDRSHRGHTEVIQRLYRGHTKQKNAVLMV